MGFSTIMFAQLLVCGMHVVLSSSECGNTLPDDEVCAMQTRVDLNALDKINATENVNVSQNVPVGQNSETSQQSEPALAVQTDLDRKISKKSFVTPDSRDLSDSSPRASDLLLQTKSSNSSMQVHDGNPIGNIIGDIAKDTKDAADISKIVGDVAEVGAAVSGSKAAEKVAGDVVKASGDVAKDVNPVENITKAIADVVAADVVAPIVKKVADGKAGQRSPHLLLVALIVFARISIQ